MMNRNRVRYLFLIFGTIALGLASRYFTQYLPDVVNLGLGDALYALMMYWMVGFLFPHVSILRITLLSLNICFLIETSQLIQSDWLISLRKTRVGALVLGSGFLWSDWLAYSFGVAFGFGLEKWEIVAQKKTPHL